jgi:hypothetical protein
MSTDASTLPLRERTLARARTRRITGVRSHERLRASANPWPARLALLAIVAASALIVVMAADRPSLLVATSHAHFLPRWLAGPLGGLVPSLTRNATELRYLYSGAIVVSYGAYLLMLANRSRLTARWVIGAIGAVHLVFLLSPPLALTDIFNYINYGRMEVLHNLNPYTTIPVSGPHTDPSYTLSNWHELLSPYGPLFTLLTLALVPLGVAGSLWTMKVLIACASLAMLHLIWKSARLLGRDPVTAVALVGLNPVVLVWGLGPVHNDFLMMLLIVLAFYLLLHARTLTPVGAGGEPASNGHPAQALLDGARAPVRGARAWLRSWGSLALPLSAGEVGAGAALVGAASIKASCAVVIPIVLAALAHRRRALAQVLVGIALAVAVVATASLAAFGLHVPALGTQSSVVANLSIPNLTGLALGAGGETSALQTLFTGAFVAVVAVCCAKAWRTRSAIAASGWATAALVVSLGWALPWYVLWVLPLAALSGSRRLRAAALVLGAYLIIAWAPASFELWKAIGFHPESTSLGALHERVARQLLY